MRSAQESPASLVCATNVSWDNLVETFLVTIYIPHGNSAKRKAFFWIWGTALKVPHVFREIMRAYFFQPKPFTKVNGKEWRNSTIRTSLWRHKKRGEANSFPVPNSDRQLLFSFIASNTVWQGKNESGSNVLKDIETQFIKGLFTARTSHSVVQGCQLPLSVSQCLFFVVERNFQIVNGREGGMKWLRYSSSKSRKDRGNQTPCHCIMCCLFPHDRLKKNAWCGIVWERFSTSFWKWLRMAKNIQMQKLKNLGGKNCWVKKGTAKMKVTQNCIACTAQKSCFEGVNEQTS